MNWLNIHTPILWSPEFIGSDPVARGTWLYVVAYCCQQENGGIIAGAGKWKDRQWQQTCGVTLAEVKSESKLLKWCGENVEVVGYPHEKQAEVVAKRAAGRKGGNASWRKRKASMASSNGSSTASSTIQAEVQRKEKGKGKEKENTVRPFGNSISGHDQLP